MSSETTQNYRLQGNPIMDINPDLLPRIGNLIYDELGKDVLRIHNKRFKGKKRIEDLTQYKEDQPISFSNVPRILSYNQILRERPENLSVLSLEDVLINWNSIPERNSTYADTDLTTLYPNQGVNEDLRQLVFKIIGKSSTRIPLVVSGLSVDPADNSYGFTFKGTDYLRVLEAPFLTKTQRIKYDPKKQEIVPSDSNEGVLIYVPEDQSGLRRLCRGRSELGAGVDYLLSSGAGGRVQVRKPKALAKNFEAILNSLKK